MFRFIIGIMIGGTIGFFHGSDTYCRHEGRRNVSFYNEDTEVTM